RSSDRRHLVLVGTPGPPSCAGCSITVDAARSAFLLGGIMDFETAVAAIVRGVLIAKLVGFVGNRMYEVVLMGLEDNAWVGPLVVGGLPWLVLIGGSLYFAFKYIGAH